MESNNRITAPSPGRWQRVTLAFALAHVLNFFVFSWTYDSIGGSAFIGKSGDGKFYVGDHGRYTAVSHLVFVFSKAQTAFVFAMHIPAMLCAVFGSKGESLYQLRLPRFSAGDWALITGLPGAWLTAFYLIRSIGS